MVDTRGYTIFKNGSTYTARNKSGSVLSSSTTDITALLDAIVADISPAGTPTVIEIGPGDFNMTTKFDNITSSAIGNITISGKGMGVTNLIVDSGITSGTIFDIEGGVTGSSTNLTSNATLGSSTVAVTSATGLVAGDPILLRSTKDWGTATSHQGKQGEIRKIVSVSSNTLTLDKWIHDTYNTADTANVIELVLLKNITLKDFTLKAGSGYTGTGTFILCKFTDNLRIDNVEVQDHYATGISLQSCINFKANVVCHQTPAATFNDQYGITVTCASENGQVNLVGKGRLRHALTIDGTTASNGEGAVRGLTVSGTAETADEAAFDTHATGENIKFINCTVHGTRNNASGGDAKGFQMRAKKVTITGCSVMEAIGKGITLMEDASNSVVSGCNIINTRETEAASLGYGIEIRSGCNNCTITGNQITGSKRDNILIRTTSSGHVISGNIIMNSGVGDGINATDNTDTTVTGNKISGNSHAIVTSGSSDRWIIVGNNEHTNTSADSLAGASNQTANNIT